MNKIIYDNSFYESQSELSRKAASIIVPIILEILCPKSVVDVGCGLGTWLSVFEELGVEEILGIDGDYVDKEKLLIPKDKFVCMDLSKPDTLNRKFDLAVCLEVAEHIPINNANALIDLIISTSDTIFFSAAIPGQGGKGHVNEQWPDYWRDLFAAKGYKMVDILRNKFWDLQEVQPWYSQNSFLFINKALQNHQINDISILSLPKSFPLRAVHPELFRRYTSLEYIETPQMIRALISRIKRKFLK
jgi:hypothetical protein